MSASNWAICPCCLSRASTAHDEVLQRVATEYGIIPVEEFNALQESARQYVDEEKLRTFREDYEIYGAKNGTVKVDYSGSCEVCGTQLSFNYEVPIPMATPPTG